VWVSLKYVLYLAPSAKCDRIFTECGRTSNTAKVGMKISGVLRVNSEVYARSKKQGKWKV